jgi:hypothetical protein
MRTLTGRAGSIAMATLLLAACSNVESPQARLDAFLEQAVSAAEERDTGEVMALVAEDYLDAQGRDRDRLRDYVRGMFLRFGSVHLDVQIVEVRQLGAASAEIDLSVGVAGERADNNPLWAMGAYRYSARLELVSDGPAHPFRLLRASWRPEKDPGNP